jgi:hypothetical protein
MQIVYENSFELSCKHCKKGNYLKYVQLTALYLLARNRVNLWSWSNTGKCVLGIFWFLIGTMIGDIY